MPPLTRLAVYLQATVALVCLSVGAALALAHPLSGMLALSAFYLLMVLLWVKPHWWLFVVPAALPVASLLPWTGWLMVDEFDLLLLAMSAALYGRRAWQAAHDRTASHQGGRKMCTSDVLIALLALFSLASTVRGFSADGWGAAWSNMQRFGLYQGYADASNSLRQVKSLLFALLCLPLLRREFDGRLDPTQPFRAFARFATGVLAGLALVALVVLWERLAYPGLLNFSSRYRTTALFWEMHVGGAAIDAYWVLTTPFLVWALARSIHLRHWLKWAFLALLVCYGVLTTFSRGVYVALGVPLILLGLSYAGAYAKVYAGFDRWVKKSGFELRLPVGQFWRKKAAWWLWVAVALEIWLVVAGSTFLADRIAQSEQDLDDRLVHWQRGLELLQSPMDWAFGKGVGRFPATYSQISDETAFPGAIRHFGGESTTRGPLESREPAFVRLTGPASRQHSGGLFMFNQRVDVPVSKWVNDAAPERPRHGALAGRQQDRRVPLRVMLEARVATNTHVWLKVCEKHLLYEGECLSRQVVLRPNSNGSETTGAGVGVGVGVGAGAWQNVATQLRAKPAQSGPASVSRSAVFSILVLTPGAEIDLRHVGLATPGQPNLLTNADFSEGLAHWFPSASSYYLPWHIDNLYLEWLIERGLAGLLLFGALAASVVYRLLRAPAAHVPMAAAVAAAVVGALLLGLVSSFLDVPRVAFFLFLVILVGNELAENPPGESQRSYTL